jgi:hypothetical protein
LSAHTLSASEIFNISDLGLQELYIPEWRGKVFIRVMTVCERQKFESLVSKGNGELIPNMRERIAVATVCDAKGNRLFDDNDIPRLSSKSAAALDRIFDKALEVNLFSKKDIDELAGELKANQT